jgi:Flp pilus assembly protein TadD
MGSLWEAKRHLKRATELGADWRTVALEELLLDAQRGVLKPDGTQILRDYVEQGHPETPHVLEALALGYLYTYRLAEAQTCLERWLELAPRDSQAFYLRGLVHQGRGLLDQAGEDYRQAVEINPEHAEARQRLADYRLYAGDYRGAAELYQQLIDRKPNDSDLVVGLVRCRRLQGRAAEARQILEPLLVEETPPVSALLEQARLAREQNDFIEAEKWYRRALARESCDADACHGLAACLRVLGRETEAKTYVARAGQIEEDLRRLRQLHQQMAEAPRNAELPYEAARICLRNGQKEEARRWFQHVLQLEPGHAGARRGLDE